MTLLAIEVAAFVLLCYITGIVYSSIAGVLI